MACGSGLMGNVQLEKKEDSMERLEDVRLR